MRAIIFDIETDGLLDELTTMHVVTLRTIDDGVMSPVYAYEGEDMDDAIGILEEADMVIGHNIVGFDLPAIEKLYPDFQLKPDCIVRDTLVMCRMMLADEKDRDFARFRKGTIPGGQIGKHGLEAWGFRFGLHKGDYAKEMKAEGKDPWKDWDPVRGVPYAIDDVEINTLLWNRLDRMEWPEESILLEHQIHELMFWQEQFGFGFNVPAALRLEKEVRAEHDRLASEAIEHFGTWVAPKKVIKGKPNPAYGEDDSRQHWGEVVEIKKTIRYKRGPNGEVLKPDRIAGDLYCPLVVKEFNPNSRPMIINRLKAVYDWEPVDFTENGTPKVDDEVLRGLGEHWPICETLAECFFHKKLLGALADGDNAWLKLVDADGYLHGHVNVGGTRTGRASHLSPNKAQVPKVKVTNDGVVRGRKGKYGWECRSLFVAPVGWWLMGCDLKGIELRCFAHHLAEFDGGEYVKIVLDGDPHTKNQQAAGLPTRDNAKTFLYATLYGAGDEKIGTIVCPPNTPVGKLKARGKELKAAFQEGLPAYRSLVRKISKQAKKKRLEGLDGRVLYVKSPHSALNMQLQSDAAIIAKKWCLIFADLMEEAGYKMGWDGDWVPCAWVHDEIQTACRTREIAEHAAKLAKQAARMSGEFFNYRCPVDADAKVGKTWAETH